MSRRILTVLGIGAWLAFAGFATPARAVSTPTSVTLTWTAPGDDSLSGTAAQYDVRWSTSPITESNFALATAASNVPVPSIAGTSESMIVTGLSPATAYWFAIRTRDDADNWSALSNVVSWTTPAAADTVRPAPFAIALGATTGTSVTLTWTATGDDSLSGTAARYDVRWSTATITAANWSQATTVTSGVPSPGAPGAAQSCTISGLDRSSALYFAVRAADEVNNWSAMSNVVSAPAQLDAAPPAAPSGGGGAVASAGGVLVQWSANAEPDLAGYRIYRTFSQATAYAQLDAALLTQNEYLDTTVPDTVSTVWYQVRAEDINHNLSAPSAAIRVQLRADDITALRMKPAYPNPSNTANPVTLPIDVPAAAGAVSGTLDIVNSAGELVRHIEIRSLPPGANKPTWDGRNDAGRTVAPGVYRVLMHVGGVSQVVRLVRTP